MRKASNFILKTPKCVIVLVEAEFTLTLKSTIETAFKKNVAPWSNFKVAAFGIYLGFALGPAGGPEMWKAASKKCQLVPANLFLQI